MAISWRLRRYERLTSKFLGIMHCSFWVELWARYLLRRPFWYTDKNGIRIQLFPEDDISGILQRGSHFDHEPTLMLVRSILCSGMTVIDVGANYGTFTLFAAPLVGEHGRIYAFEPTIYSFERLKRNVQRFDPEASVVRLENTAVGNRTGMGKFYEFSPGYSAWNSFGYHVMTSQNGPIEPSETKEVPIITLDSYCAALGIDKISLLKIDAEGFEVEVLQGCRRLLSEGRISCIVFEISDEPLKGRSEQPIDVIHAVQSVGFDVFLIDSDGGLVPVNSHQCPLPRFANYYGTIRRS